MTLQRLTRISFGGTLCRLRRALPLSPMSNLFRHLFFLLVMFEGYSFAFVMMITVLSPPFFLGMSLIVFFQIVAFGCWCSWHISYRWLPFYPSDPFVGLLSFAYGVLIDGVYALIYHIPWWTYALVNGFTFNWPMLYQRSFIPLSIISLGRFYVEKIISSLDDLACSSSLVSCTLSHNFKQSTNNFEAQKLPRKRNFDYSKCDARWSQAQSKTLKVAEDSNLMKVLKANHKIEEKNGHDHLGWWPTAKTKPKGFTGCTDQWRDGSQRAAETTVKKRGQDRILSRSVQIMSSRIMSGSFFDSIGAYLKLFQIRKYLRNYWQPHITVLQ